MRREKIHQGQHSKSDAQRKTSLQSEARTRIVATNAGERPPSAVTSGTRRADGGLLLDGQVLDGFPDTIDIGGNEFDFSDEKSTPRLGAAWATTSAATKPATNRRLDTAKTPRRPRSPRWGVFSLAAKPAKMSRHAAISGSITRNAPA
jgi:hypothetical protein